ncbi:aminoglycoside 3-N-acetyltransferase [Kribbella sp. VKM Ac-2566]|uniref:aminoglycoside 3-N-acetyltransferase n=1 Tax=Kribbella sp. VKM Ac-2566 TaxID=2512218 RepID=UPI0010E91997|nr:aminoglycoside 3-N-acetyltransferase [Kribbella sp. VKM Ac-2566]TDW91088.1 aminoglycoside 3-N-acetyltransferase [Kribbella sp. VKM Ac-2566]
MDFPSESMLNDSDFAPLTRSQITRALIGLGVVEGETLMVHVRLSALGWVVGGIDTVVLSLRDALGSDGTLLAFCGWDDSPYHVSFWPPHWQKAYEEIPAFDPKVSSARRDFGRFPERLRTWPGALRSTHPEVSFAALGRHAANLVTGTDDDNPWGAGGPLGRLVDLGGRVLLLGAPLKTLTLCHHAEAVADVAGKRYHSYRMPVRTDAGTIWRDYCTLDTFYGALPYWERPDLPIDSAVGTLALQAVQAGAGREGNIGAATAWLFDSRATIQAVVAWIERHF